MMKGFLKPESRLPRDEKEIARFILRHPAFNGGWLLFLAAEIHERSRTHNSITVTVSVDNYLSWMDIAVSGLPELPDMPFCDFFIRRQQFIYPGGYFHQH